MRFGTNAVDLLSMPLTVACIFLGIPLDKRDIRSAAQLLFSFVADPHLVFGTLDKHRRKPKESLMRF